jgi:hypothetical protein
MCFSKKHFVFLVFGSGLEKQISQSMAVIIPIATAIPAFTSRLLFAVVITVVLLV